MTTTRKHFSDILKENLEIHSIKKEFQSEEFKINLYEQVDYYDSDKTTSSLTTKIVNYFKSKNYQVKPEKEINIDNKSMKDFGYNRQRGFCDIYAKKGDIQFYIEIDRGNKEWSIQKLDYMVKQGFNRIWIRWKGELNQELVNKYSEKIKVVNISNLDKQIEIEEITEKIEIYSYKEHKRRYENTREYIINIENLNPNIKKYFHKTNKSLFIEFKRGEGVKSFEQEQNTLLDLIKETEILDNKYQLSSFLNNSIEKVWNLQRDSDNNQYISFQIKNEDKNKSNIIYEIKIYKDNKRKYYYKINEEDFIYPNIESRDPNKEKTIVKQLSLLNLFIYDKQKGINFFKITTELEKLVKFYGKTMKSLYKISISQNLID